MNIATCRVPVATLDADPYPTYAQLRRSAPVAWVPAAHAHFVTRWDDVLHVARDTEAFSAAVHDSPLSRTIGPNLLHSDDPEHTRARAPLSAAMRPSAVEAHFRAAVVAALVRVRRQLRGRTEIDLIGDFAEPFCQSVLRDITGLPAVDVATMRRWSHGIGSGASNFHRDPGIAARAAEVSAEVDEAVLSVLRQGAPAHSLIAKVSGGESRPSPFELQRITSTVKLLIIGGMQEPRDLFGFAMLAYLRDPRVRRDVDTDPAGVVPRLIEEALRWGSPVGTITRVSTRDVELSGTLLPAGSVVAAVLASANRDPDHWVDPDVFDPRRDDLHHVAFAAGVHTCVGASLARLEVGEAIRGLLEDAELLELTSEPVLRGWEFRGPVSLRVRTRRPRRRQPPRPDRARTATPSEVLITDLVVETVDVITIKLETVSGTKLPDWEPGAHIDVLLPTGQARQYSLCGSLHDEHWEIGVRRDDTGRGGSAWLHDNARPGMKLTTRGPRNHFELAREGRCLFIAGGIGITPLLPMIERTQGPWELLYLGRGRERMPFLDRLAQYGRSVTVHDTATSGRPDLAALLAQQPDGTVVYCCGPEGLIAAVEEAAGRHRHRVRSERFAASSQGLDPRNERAFSVVLSRTGPTIPVAADETVLDALERTGVFLPSSCREGVCGSCELRVISGDCDHRDAVIPAADRSPNDPFFPCVSRARTGDLVLDV